MEKATLRVLLVDDYAPWRDFAKMMLQNRLDLQIAGEASDGLEALQKAKELRPDLILMDLGLPGINGIEAARKIRSVLPESRIVFVSENVSPEIVEIALAAGSGGYVIKSEAATELLPALEAILEGRQFVSARLADHGLTVANADPPARNRHDVAFYADDNSLVDGFARFIETALGTGNVVVVGVNEFHRARLLLSLERDGVDVAAAIKQGSYIAADPAETLSKVTVNGMPDADRCAKVLGDIVTRAAKGLRGKHTQVVVCGEMAPNLLVNGNVEGALTLERLWHEIGRAHGINTLCGYLASAFAAKDGPVFERICAEHSVAYGRELGPQADQESRLRV